MSEHKKPNIKKNMIIMLICVGIAFGGLYAFQLYKGRVLSKIVSGLQNKIETVSSYKATKQLWTDKVSAVGTLIAIMGTDLTPELPGTITHINFSSGEDVQKGMLLIELDTTQEVAQLKSLQAQETLARQTLDRDLKQYKVNAVSKQQIDVDWSNLKNLQGQVQNQLAIIAKKNIRAPFSGRLGIRQVSVGQLLNPGQAYVNLQQLDDLFVDFYIPQRFLSTIKQGQEIEVSVDTYPDLTIKGKVVAVDAQVTVTNGNARVRGRFANPNKELIPGMFADVETVVSAPKEQVTVPQTAVTYNSYGITVYVLTKTDEMHMNKPVYTAKQRFIETGSKRGDQIVISKGLKADELVVSAGQLKLRNGSKVVIDNSVLPLNDPNPKPVEQ
ncbi:efflux transporter, RND family, MFP subunit [Pseudovibrio sp. FO-BEG1]|uniref:Membrane fusion protein, multidrug efflux system n=1 Tax=Pseudovibrio denitrificans TaxID=258256 RepID=A0A1I7CKG0_9HYPH|nr:MULTISPECIES: efflux RND transporter periplasmic adaptor subunit [Pseudovibrio]AEV35789.1 efflux transporter, RND family, MFP subunit [Pseudovibrio sp. FO-BEG1]SFT99906.1 membrane fusion protein, multidrug efflux system [Pseudovibrio denitrificans]